MTKKKKKTKQKISLDKSDFAFLCHLVQLGADVVIEDFWDEMASQAIDYEDPVTGEIDPLFNDIVTDKEGELFARVDHVLMQVARKFGYPNPIWDDDGAERDVAVWVDDKKPPVSPTPPTPLPPLVVKQAPGRTPTTP